MPWQSIHTEEERIDFEARLMRLHDPDEIRARYWHDNMKIQRVVVTIMAAAAALGAYYLVPFVFYSANRPVVAKFWAGALWVLSHVLTVVGGACCVAYFLIRGRLQIDE